MIGGGLRKLSFPSLCNCPSTGEHLEKFVFVRKVFRVVSTWRVVHPVIDKVLFRLVFTNSRILVEDTLYQCLY